MKKHLIFVLALITVLCMTMFFVACTGCNGDPGPDVPPAVSTDPTITMNNPNVNMVLGDSTTLTVVITNKSDDYTLSWKSSDTSIATVDGGKVLAIKEGRATITATYSNGTKSYEATASVSVDLGGNIPVLNIDNDIFEDSSYNILVGSNFEIQPYIFFNGNKYYDVDITYTVADNTKAEMNGNKIVTKAVGETTITLVASWRGIVYNEMNLMKKVISIKVSNDQLFQLNNGTLSDIILYSRSSWGDKEYKSEMPFVVTAIYNGQLSDVDPVITIADKSIVSLEGTTLKAKSFGSTEISCVWKSPNNETYVKIITVDVVRPVKEFNQTIEYFSTLDGLALYEQNGVLLETKLTELVYGTNNVELFDAFQTYTDVKDNVLVENKPLTIRNDNTLVGVYSYSTGMQDVTITIGTKSEITKFNIKTATKVFAQDNAGDFFATFQVPVIDYEMFAGKDTRSGYYILAEDINGIEVGFLNSGSFAGVFDGLGHVINNVKVSGPYGMFGSIIDNATIRNVAFNNVEFTAQSNYLFAYNATSTKIISLENVYINIKEQATVKSNTSVLFRTGAGFKANNVVVIYPFANATIGNAVNYGSLFGAHTDFDVKGAFSNVYVVSPLQIGKGNFVEDSQKGYANIDAANIDTFAPTADSGVKAKSTYRYATLAQMTAANNTYNSLSSDYWEVINGIPVWKRVALDAFISKNGVNVNSLTVAGTYNVGIKTATGTENAIVSSNSNKVTISGNTITLAQGTYNALITVKNASSTVEKVYKVSVDTRNASEIDEDIVIGLNNSKLFLNGTSIASEVPNSVVYNSEELLSASGVLSVGNINKPVNTPFALTISTDNAKYNLTNVRLVSGAYEDTPQSRTEFAELFSSGDRNYEENFKADRIEGYYVLVEDLYFDDHNGTDKLSSREGFSNHEGIQNTFACTLDGRGHSLNNIILSRKGGSMFGIVSDGAVIKNIAFNHVGNYSATEGFVESPMVTVLFNHFESKTSSLLLENVYGYRYSNDGGYYHGFLSYHGAYVDGVEVAPTNVTMKNVVLEQAGAKSLYPLFGYVMNLDLTNFAKNFKDVYFITEGQLSRGWDNVTDLGITEQEAINNRIIKFANRSAMANANLDYSTFNSDYWTNVNGEIVFNSTVAVPYLLDSHGEPIDDLRTTVAGATFTAGIKGVSGDEVAILEADNSNVTITGNTITLGGGTYKTTLYVKTPSGTILASYPIIVDTREPELVEDKLTIVKTDTEVDFSNTALADKEILAISFNAVDLYENGVFNGALLKGTKADRSILDGNLIVETTDGLYAFNNVTIYDKLFYNTKESREELVKLFSNSVESKNREAGAYALAENLVFDTTNANEVFINKESDCRIFSDMLNGNGFALTNVMINAVGYSAFGNWSEGAIIKNIAFNNFYLATVNNGSITSLTRKPTRGLLFHINATADSVLTLDNVYQYVEYEEGVVYSSSLVWGSATGAINANNVFIHIVDKTTAGNIGTYHSTVYTAAVSRTATNSYVVNPSERDNGPLGTRYTSLDAMKAAELNLNVFTKTGMWKVVDGVLTWNSLAD